MHVQILSSRSVSVALLLAVAQSGCQFQPHVTPLVIPEPPSSAIGGPVSAAATHESLLTLDMMGTTSE